MILFLPETALIETIVSKVPIKERQELRRELLLIKESAERVSRLFRVLEKPSLVKWHTASSKKH